MKTIIIGGGAAGLFAACTLARSGAQVTLLEKQNRVGRKLLSTGNGRCNLSNLNASEKGYFGDARYIRTALKALTPQQAVDFFESIGLICCPDEEGRVYPLSNQAAGVLDALRLYADEQGCETITEFEVKSIVRKKNSFIVEAADGRKLTADFVIIACGGLAAPKLGGCGDGYKLLESFGHKISPRFPAIAALKTDPEAVRALKGIRMQGEIELISGDKVLRREKGEMLFSETGVSGIAAMQLARAVNLEMQRGKKCAVRLNFLPGAAEDFIVQRAGVLSERPLEDFLSGIVPKRLGQVLIKNAGITPLSMLAGDLTRSQCAAIQRELTGWTLNVKSTLGFDQAQVTCGGAELKDFDPETLESRRAPGLFAAGEVLNVDGDCGGFNLHWAWASANLCAQAILERIR
ncbi:MAG: aminoacetone oxidase family FAD-binding enzyme [Clostridia bacterium]|nr:aminoacetone oxidase family FAD-binding enzyme [Clostridia bacterium]